VTASNSSHHDGASIVLRRIADVAFEKYGVLLSVPQYSQLERTAPIPSIKVSVSAALQVRSRKDKLLTSQSKSLSVVTGCNSSCLLTAPSIYECGMGLWAYTLPRSGLALLYRGGWVEIGLHGIAGMELKNVRHH
jgi:hypothetical protein